MGRYFGDLRWTTAMATAITLTTLVTHLPYLTTGQRLDFAEAIRASAHWAFRDINVFVRDVVLGDLAPFMYVVLALYVLTRGRGALGELGFRFRAHGPWPIITVLALSGAWATIALWPMGPMGPVDPIELAYSIIVPLYPVAIGEEVIFRGFILGRLLPSGIGLGKLTSVPRAMPAVLISSIYFTLPHVPGYAAMYGDSWPIYIVYPALFGVVSGTMYILTSGIVPSLILHWVTNSLTYYAALAQPGG